MHPVCAAAPGRFKSTDQPDRCVGVHDTGVLLHPVFCCPTWQIYVVRAHVIWVLAHVPGSPLGKAATCVAVAVVSVDSCIVSQSLIDRVAMEL